ncbi:polyribonucleotide nucleotidyltransferase [bacterium]|nr:polyribonucleotide nucleotidyltransferase [bacterium]
MFNETKIECKELGFSISTGKIARQAGGSVVIEAGETVVFGSACAKTTAREGQDFFPLTVDYREKTYAAGKIPGGFFKREARPTTKETLISRLIDRPIRPLFPEKYKNETQIILQTLAYDGQNRPEIMAINAASAALSISDSPFNGPIGGVRVGLVDGKLVINPTTDQMANSDLDLMLAGTKKAITMVESEANILSEDQYLEALRFGHENIKIIVACIEELVAKVGKEKQTYVAPVRDEDLYSELVTAYYEPFKASFEISSKLEREAKSNELKAAIDENFSERFEADSSLKNLVHEYLHDIEYDVIRKMIVVDKKRIDNREVDQLRAIECEVDMFARLHGSALFTRGETQSLGVLTLGGGDDAQFVDGLDESSREPFYLHYNFPPFSVGECGRFIGPGRREIGHGELASKAIRAILPSQDEFPYTIRLVSEIMESNGSSSMATVCSGIMAMMAGGVPIKAPVAGIAMGLFMDEASGEYTVITDIQGAEDHYGDMDFKVAGTTEGITALQMDIKIEGITIEIMTTALEQAKKARLEILESMDKAISTPREDIAACAPRILMIDIPKEKIGDIIGPGGKMIRKISEMYSCKIEISEDEANNRGIVKILASDGEKGDGAYAFIKSMVTDPEVGEIYESKVIRITDFGAFCEFLPGKEGLLHISKISKKGRLNSVSDVLQEGDQISLKLIEKDRQGRFSLSAQEVEENDF